MKNEVLGERLRLFKDRDSLDEFSLCRKRQSYRNRRRQKRSEIVLCQKTHCCKPSTFGNNLKGLLSLFRRVRKD